MKTVIYENFRNLRLWGALMATASALCLGAAQADVGIGTETPTASLHVVGEGAGAGRDLRVEHLDPPASDATLRVVVSDPDGYLFASDLDDFADLVNGGGSDSPDDDWRLATGAGSPMTIDSAIFTNNQVGIGTPTPAYSLDVDGDIRATGSIFVSDRVITHASFATSDARYKHSVAPLDDGLALVRQLAPRRFSYTDDAPMANKDRVYYGLIAQEAAQVDPNLVETFLLPTPTETEPREQDAFLGVDSQRLIFILLAAIRELDQKTHEIDALRAQLALTEARLDAAGLPFTAAATPDPRNPSPLSAGEAPNSGSEAGQQDGQSASSADAPGAGPDKAGP